MKCNVKFIVINIALNVFSSYSLASPALLPTINLFPDWLKAGHTSVQLGGHWIQAGKSQHININTQIGDTFTVNKNHSSNGLVGLGYFVDGPAINILQMSYGINGFYLPRTSVSGFVVQEDLYTNLSYGYNLTNYPVYAVARSTINLKSESRALTFNVGIGPNFMRASGFQEQPLDGITVPDHPFSGHSTTQFSATAGIGLKFNQIFGEAPLECGYQFFYLGQGRFNKTTPQILNNLQTGAVFANALLCSVSI